MTKRGALLALVLVALSLVGCAFPWTVVKQAKPNPLRGKTAFVVLPIDYTGLKINKMAEAQYIAEKKDKTATRFPQDKLDMNALFSTNLQATAKNDGIDVQIASTEVTTYVIKPHIGLMESGFYAVVASAPSRVVMRLKIEDKDGKLVDEIEIEHKTSPSDWAKIEEASRYKSDAEEIGKIAGEYLVARVRSKEPD